MNYFTFQSKPHLLFAKYGKKTKFSTTPLTLYSTITYLFSVFSVTSVADIFFNPNTHLRPIMGRFYISTLGAKCAMGYLFWSLAFWSLGFV
jgi:hypothetical protein